MVFEKEKKWIFTDAKEGWGEWTCDLISQTGYEKESLHLKLAIVNNESLGVIRFSYTRGCLVVGLRVLEIKLCGYNYFSSRLQLKGIHNLVS